MDIEEEEEETVTLQIPYEADMYDIITIPKTELFEVTERSGVVKSGCTSVHRWAIATRLLGPLGGKAFLLNNEFDWKLGEDDDSRLCLVPIKKDD